MWNLCFGCLERCINSDFSDHRFLFSYGLSDSPLPFGSSAVVQISTGNAENSASSSSSQFILVQLLARQSNCFTNYVKQYMPKHIENGDNQGTHDVNQGLIGARDLSACKSTTLLSLDQPSHLINDNSKSTVNWMGCESSLCTLSSRFSCFRIISALAPFARVDVCSYHFFEKLVSEFSSGCLEDQVLCSLNLLTEGKASGRESVNFLHLVGIPSFSASAMPGSLRHPNMAPILGLLKSSDYVYSVVPKTPYTLEGILHYCPNALKSEWQARFLIYQLLSALAYLHGLGVSHGNICPSSIMLTHLFWAWLPISNKPISQPILSLRDIEFNIPATSAKLGCCADPCPSQGLYADLSLSPYTDWDSQFEKWWKGELSNFEYLLILNRLAGRRWGDHTFHTVMPWVIDFSTKPEESSDAGWRDLSKSKWRLAKGDEQLDFTYASSEIPHHISDECLSELAVCSYKARRLPLSVLRRAVRSVYEPNEYPSSMQRLYQWTPDECIPEFYCDPQIFYSVHSGMTDLAVPSWVGSPEEFIKLHRDALESKLVSSQIHSWIDITFGYKMSGQAAVEAKNVMLASSEATIPRSMGRRQLFTRPHPVRRGAKSEKHYTSSIMNECQVSEVQGTKPVLLETGFLQELEEASAFTQHAKHLSPRYCYNLDELVKDISSSQDSVSRYSEESLVSPLEISRNYGLRCYINSSNLLENMETEVEGSMEYQELLCWMQKSCNSGTRSYDISQDIFSIGCVLAELYLKKPLFNSSSLHTYLDLGILPSSIHELPPQTKLLVKACIQKDWTRRPSTKSILESCFFPTTVKSSYLYVAPLQLLAKDGSRLTYAANFAKQGALKAMGTFAAEMCAPYCLPLVVRPQSDSEAESAYILLKEFIKCLTPKAVRTLILPAIQKILQTTGYSHLKVSLLQVSFVQEIWNLIGKQAYLEKLHPLVISNLHGVPHKTSAIAASVLLIGTSEELGIPITVNQTILPLIRCFGKGLCSDGIDALVRIGGLLGQNFIVKHILPLLKQVVRSCTSLSYMNKPEPIQSWSGLALIDCLTTLDGLVAFLPLEVVVKELIEDKGCLYVMVLMQTNLEIPVLQVATTTLMAICHRIGPDLTALHVLPQLKDLFDELAFSQETGSGSGSFDKNLKIPKPRTDGEFQIESRMDLVVLLYPSFASLLGIEKLRQRCATWLLLEQFLLRYHNWKWEYTGESSRSGSDNVTAKKPAVNKASSSEYNPAKLLLNGVGWSIPQSQLTRGSKNMMPQGRSNSFHQIPVETHLVSSNLSNREPWFWYPSSAPSWDGPDFTGRIGSLKDEPPWKIKASIIYSIRAHHGALRSLAITRDECTLFTAGVGPGFKGTVQKWELSRINCTSGYHGHEEAVNDICVLSSTGRMASCDGTIHVWNSRTGKVISVFSEPSVDITHLVSPSSFASRTSMEHPNMLNANTLSSGLLTSGFDGSLYTCMHHLEFVERLVVGTGNGSLRFIDVARGEKLHLWKGESFESSFTSLVSTICSCGSDSTTADGAFPSPSWIAAGFSSGHCRLFDSRSGNVVAFWRAHDGYVTKLAAPEEHLLVSSSHDRTLRIWDLRRNFPRQPIVYKGHTDAISGFSVWGQDVISISRNKIGLSTLSWSSEEEGQGQIKPQKLYVADHGGKNLSILSSISILPFSRLFVVGSEDGYLRICC
ncbi:hypothetical protein K2173_022318 [Erythroxylum novogranatense]|uniref:BEACH domain-containing protein n=1 Tax=Erythroxylum novogranatense TaxID=1862640 RepID=A0AAV8TJY3_9ROSI|nr:hypothetical protein K2173_022318 [Erythroxylum novogranatense]